MNGIPQMPIHGQSLAYTFPNGPDDADHKQVQYFEMFGHRGIWANGWKAVAYHSRGSRSRATMGALSPRQGFFGVPQPCGVASGKTPRDGRPVVDRGRQERRAAARRPAPGTVAADAAQAHAAQPTRYVIPPVGHINSDVAPAIGNRRFKITAEIDRPRANSQGCLVSYGASPMGSRSTFSATAWCSTTICSAAISRRCRIARFRRALERGRGVRRLGKNGRATELINGEACGTSKSR